ncbi:radical SAM protein [Clostridium sp. KNHs214]|uniref:radical SAM protein n=1 Tax=Clostridium sp. KNHs214 TaxID=1540257 RepID=UPI00054E5509|nr:radical SAM protein [Clostridium sp. KNHs214]
MEKNQILRVQPGGIAEEVGIEPNDKLLSINGNIVKDIIDYKFLVTDEFVTIEVEKQSGEVWEIEIEKGYDEDLGIEFKDFILDKPRSCHNKCMFCFIDQLPTGMRKTLYFKDDDSRLSFFQGNFVTLTNMSDEEIDRIIKYKISPINVSVHTTNPELRAKMLNNRFAGRLYEIMQKMAKAKIEMNCQIVSCPGINNGKELINTVEDLYKLYPRVKSVAVVPIGITKFRENLYPLEIYSEDTAREEIFNIQRIQEKYMNEIGSPFVRLSDEFYVMAGLDVPKGEFYGEYPQLEDGVGMIRLFRENIEKTLEKLNKKHKGSFTIITGKSAYKEILEASMKIMKCNSNIKIHVKKIINHFFGETITVAGLLTGKDIMEQTKEEELGKYIILSDNTLRKGYELEQNSAKVLLDDVTLEDLERNFNRKIVICDYTGEDLIDIINSYSEEE